jgi:hypothetical protein
MKTHKDYNVGDMFIYEPEDNEPHTKVIYYISEKTRFSKSCHFEYKLIRLDEVSKWANYYGTKNLNEMISRGYKHIPVVK